MGSDRNTRAGIGVAGIMDRETIAALSRGGIADITTIGRKSGAERRIEIYFHALDGRLFLTGRPGSKRDWMANLLANPSFTLHLKRGVSADVPVEAVPVHELGIHSRESRSGDRTLAGSGSAHRVPGERGRVRLIASPG
jgi:hypothetical protein